MPSKCAEGQFYLYLYNIPRFNLEICPAGFVSGGRMKGLTFLRNVSYAISYCNPDLTPSSVTISNQDYLVLAVTAQRPQSPACGRDDRALWFPPLRLLCYSPPTSRVYVSESKALVPILRPQKEVPRMVAAQTAFLYLPTATFSSGLYQPTPSACRYQRLSLPGFVLTKWDWRGRKRKKA